MNIKNSNIYYQFIDMNSTIVDFKERVLFPAIYERANVIFPEFKESRQRGKRWESPHHLDGSTSPDGEGCYIGSKPEYKCTVADRNGGREKPMNYIDFYMRRNNVDYKAALNALCVACNLTPPTYGNEEEYKKHRSRQEKLLHLVIKMREALFSVEGKAVLDYLKDPIEGRGYSQELCKNMGLGCLTESLYNELFETKDEATGSTLFYPSQIMKNSKGQSHPLVIPYIVSGTILGFKFRTIQKGKEGAEKWQNTKDLDRLPFGLTDAHLTGGKYLDLDIVVVESELDALRAQAMGYPNIVAAAGGSLSAEGLQKLIKHGAKRITIALDTEAMPEKNAQTDIKREKMAKAAHAEGLKAYVATFPAQEGEKMDLDDFFRAGYTIEDFQRFIENAPTFVSWKYLHLQDCIIKKAEEEKGISEKMFYRDFLDEVVELCVEYANPLEAGTINTQVAAVTGYAIKPADLDAYYQKKKDEANRLKVEREAKEAAVKIQELLEAGQTREAFRLMERTVKKGKELSTEAELAELLRQPTIDEILEELSTQPEGYHTTYFFDNGNEPEQLIIPSGAITFVCGLAGHGKSTFLMNLAVEMAQDKRTEGKVLYFTYEEKKVVTRGKIENIALNEYLSKNNKKTLNTLHAKRYALNTLDQNSKFKDNIEGLKQKEREALRVFDDLVLYAFEDDKSVDKLTTTIKYLDRHMKIKAVFVDYVQRLTKEGISAKDNTEKLKEVCNDLMNISVSTGLPFVCAAQFNRDMKSPLDMRAQNIAESADLERAANVMIGLWNSSAAPTGNAKLTNDEILEFNRKGITFGQYGKIYAKILKNRDGICDIDTVFKYDGNLGSIKDTNPEHQKAYAKYLREEQEGQQATLAFSDEATTQEPEPEPEPSVIYKEDENEYPF